VRKWFLVVALLAAVALMAPSAQAGTIFHFDFVDVVNGHINGAGQLTATETSLGSGMWYVASGEMAVFGGPGGNYSLIANPTPGATSLSPLGNFFYDNVLYYPYVWDGGNFGTPGTPALDNSGLLFGNASYEINLFGNGTTLKYSFWGAPPQWQYSNNDMQFDIAETSTEVPEPATLTLLGLGLAGIARAARRRKR
jgi:hypothetical protein